MQSCYEIEDQASMDGVWSFDLEALVLFHFVYCSVPYRVLSYRVLSCRVLSYRIRSTRKIGLTPTCSSATRTCRSWISGFHLGLMPATPVVHSGLPGYVPHLQWTGPRQWIPVPEGSGCWDMRLALKIDASFTTTDLSRLGQDLSPSQFSDRSFHRQGGVVLHRDVLGNILVNGWTLPGLRSRSGQTAAHVGAFFEEALELPLRPGSTSHKAQHVDLGPMIFNAVIYAKVFEMVASLQPSQDVSSAYRLMPVVGVFVLTYRGSLVLWLLFF